MAAARKALAQQPGAKPVPSRLNLNIGQDVDDLLRRIEAGQRQGLAADFQALVDKYPGHHMTNYGMGVYLGMVESDPIAAIPFFEEACRIFPAFVEALYNLGNSYVKAGRVPLAVDALRKTIRYCNGDDYIERAARKQLFELEEIIKKTTPYPSLDACLENQKRFDSAFENLTQRRYARAIELFQEVLKHNPEHVQSYGNMALAEAGLGHKAAALACLDKALELDPSYEPARHNRQGIQMMKEGAPHVPFAIAETEYYRDVVNAKSGGEPWWKKLKLSQSD